MSCVQRAHDSRRWDGEKGRRSPACDRQCEQVQRVAALVARPPPPPPG